MLVDWQGVEYTRSLVTGWKAPLRVRRLSEDESQGIRDRFHIIVEGDHLPAPIIDFADMKLPPAVRRRGLIQRACCVPISGTRKHQTPGCTEVVLLPVIPCPGVSRAIGASFCARFPR